MRGNEEAADEVLRLYSWEKVKARFWTHFEGGLVWSTPQSIPLATTQREIL